MNELNHKLKYIETRELTRDEIEIEKGKENRYLEFCDTGKRLLKVDIYELVERK